MGHGGSVGSVKVILDTNFLILLAKGVISIADLSDVVSFKYELLTTSAVVGELEEMATKGDMLSRHARRALGMLRSLGVEVIDNGLSGDESIEQLAATLKAQGQVVIVATNDVELRKRLRRLGIPTVFLREQSMRLQLDWEPLL